MFTYTPSADVKRAMSASLPIVALESTVLTHGLPRPQNLYLARDMENAVRENFANPNVSQMPAEKRGLLSFGRKREEEHKACFAGSVSFVYASQSHIEAVLSSPSYAHTLSRNAAALASGYTWSITAARLRRLYSDLKRREPVHCAAYR